MSLLPKKISTLNDLYVNELRDLYSAETQLVMALPRMIDAATSEELKNAFAEHLEQTRGHVTRLEEILFALDEEPVGTICEAMKGLIKEGDAYIDARGDAYVRDAALVATGRRIEHYEIAGYETVRELAVRLGSSAAAVFLQKTLFEEEGADRKLATVAQIRVNSEAAASS